MNIVIVGATGAVGKEMIRCLEELEFPITQLRLVASARSAGKEIQTKFGAVKCEEISEAVFAESDIALFSAGSDISREWRERVVANNCLMIDNSSAFRYEEDVPLVVPEINPEAARQHNGVIANPNCTTAIAAVVLWPLHQKFKIKKAIFSTYQATSGAGAAGMQELLDQSRAILNKETDSSTELMKEVATQEAQAFSHPIAFNVIPHIDAFQDNQYTKEEMKVVWETRKIFNEPELSISCTCVRIPTLRAHSESIVLEFESAVDPVEAKNILSNSPGVKLTDDPSQQLYPMPLNASGEFAVEVGRLRRNLVFGENGLELFLCGDQLLKGAALNAAQIAKLFTN